MIRLGSPPFAGIDINIHVTVIFAGKRNQLPSGENIGLLSLPVPRR